MARRVEPLRYSPSSLAAGVVHIGWGNFARAFIGEYLHDVAQAGHKDWGFVAIAPSDRQILDITNLQRQNCIYHLLKRNGEETCTRVGALMGIMIGARSANSVIQRLSNPSTRIATLTITQAGYCIDVNKEPEDSERVHADIAALRNKDYGNIATVPGWITAALHQCMVRGTTPFTPLSCDNLPGNGNLLKRVVMRYAADTAPDLASYIENEVCFPNSVVDRVTPHQNYHHNQGYLQANYGIESDAVPVVCEPYRKLVIEDSFSPFCKPPLDSIDDTRAKASFVSDVAPYEDRKLRLLNGSHLAIGLVSKVLQLPTVLEATRDKDVRDFWLGFLGQAAEGLRPMSVDNYVSDTIERLDNPHLTDQTDRLLAATTSKIAVRLFNEPALRQRKPTDASAFAIAAWLRYMLGRDDSGNPYNIHPHDVGKIEELGLTTTANIKANLPHILTQDRNLANSAQMQTFANKVTDYFKLIRSKGLRAAICYTFADENLCRAQPIICISRPSLTPEGQ